MSMAENIQKAIDFFKKDFPDYIHEEPSERQIAYNTAIEALEKQIPKKLVAIRKIKEFDGYDMGNCPICNEPLDNSFYDNLKYCFVCGQKIDWEDGE